LINLKRARTGLRCDWSTVESVTKVEELLGKWERRNSSSRSSPTGTKRTCCHIRTTGEIWLGVLSPRTRWDSWGENSRDRTINFNWVRSHAVRVSTWFGVYEMGKGQPRSEFSLDRMEGS
jgi:hypothetical protein